MDRIVLGFLFAFFATSLHAKNPLIPQKIVSGRQHVQLTERERFNQVMGQLGGLGPELGSQLRVQAVRRQAQTLIRILPDWTRNIPLSLLLFLDFEENEEPLARARKYLRLALLIRDMYMDLPLNREVLDTYTIPMEERLTDAQREQLVGQAFAAAAEIVRGREPGLTAAEREDFWLSLAQLDYWTFYHLALAGPEHLQGAWQAANRAYIDINQAQTTRALHDTHFWDQVARMQNGIRYFASQILTPILLLTLQFNYFQHSK